MMAFHRLAGDFVAHFAYVGFKLPLLGESEVGLHLLAEALVAGKRVFRLTGY